MRIVSLCPSLTELVFDLGAGSALVGRTKFCVHPSDGVAAVEKVGGTKNPKVERIIALAPDLVLMNEEENRREDADAMRAAGISIHSSMPRTAEETAVMVRDIGAAIGRPNEAARIADEIERQATDVRSRTAEGKPVTYAYLIWREPWMSISDDTFVAGLLQLAGGRNVFGDSAERYPAITIGDLVERSPERVLLSTEPFPFQERHVEELADATGLPPARFRIVDGELLSWHGSRTVRGIPYAEQVLRS